MVQTTTYNITLKGLVIALAGSILFSTKAIFVKVKGTHTAQSMYRPSLEVTDAAEKNSSTLELISANDAKYNITAIAKKYNLFKGASLKLYLVLNPANSKMMVRSQRIFLATLTNK